MRNPRSNPTTAVPIAVPATAPGGPSLELAFGAGVPLFGTAVLVLRVKFDDGDALEAIITF
jgi:hypothetical protein